MLDSNKRLARGRLVDRWPVSLIIFRLGSPSLPETWTCVMVGSGRAGRRSQSRTGTRGIRKPYQRTLSQHDELGFKAGPPNMISYRRCFRVSHYFTCCQTPVGSGSFHSLHPTTPRVNDEKTSSAVTSRKTLPTTTIIKRET